MYTRAMKALLVQKKHSIGLVIVIILVCICTFLVIRRSNNDSGISRAILNKASFTILYPQKNTPHITDVDKSVSYNSGADALSYLTYVYGKTVYISEQSTPSIFSQSGVYDYKLTQSKEYDDFSTEAGDIALTRPTELDGQTLAWDNANGTLILARAIKSLSENEWKLLFNNMAAVNE
jgi:hypothetical protein